MNIKQAREQVANNLQNSMIREQEQNLFASHVTNEDKIKYFTKRQEFINSVRLGAQDNNLTIKQRIHYILTGEIVAILNF